MKIETATVYEQGTGKVLGTYEFTITNDQEEQCIKAQRLANIDVEVDAIKLRIATLEKPIL